MTEQKISELLRTEYIGRSLFCFEKLNSTNDFLKDAADGLPDGCAAVTMEQLAGKGRRGHAWVSPKGQMAAFSVLIKNQKAERFPVVSLISALAVQKTLKNLFDADFSIKWPNDIILFGKKICGILCESKITGSGCNTVSGIGVNLTQNPDFFKSAGVPHGASIKMLTGKIPEPEKVIAEVLNTFEEIYISATKSEENRKRFFEEYSASCITIGREIKAQSADGEIRGRAVSVNEDGTLNVEVNGEIVRLIASEVSVRGIMGYV